jgi:hypothetical protein
MLDTLAGQPTITPTVKVEDYPHLRDLAVALSLTRGDIEWDTARTTNGADCVHFWNDAGVWVCIEPGPLLNGWSVVALEGTDEETIAYSSVSAGDAARLGAMVIREEITEALEGAQ